jgi:hypothetical protein
MSFCSVFRSRPRVRLCGALSVAMFLVAPLRTPAQNVEEMREYQKKADCIMSFTRFVEWPEYKLGPANTPFVIGVFGVDRISTLLREALQGRLIKGRPVVVKSLSRRKELRTCHLLFVSRSEHHQLGQILRGVRKQSILTVGECADFLNHGGVLNFVSVGTGVRFQISTGAAAHQNLEISSKLLQLAVPTDPDRSLAPAGGSRPTEPPQQAKAR